MDRAAFTKALHRHRVFRLMKLADIILWLEQINDGTNLVELRRRLSNPLARVLIALAITPTQLNMFGLTTGIASAFYVGKGQFAVGAALLAFSALADAMDGFVARTLGTSSRFGEFFDSVCDRYVDTSLLLGLGWWFVERQKTVYVLLIFCSIVGVVVTSYSRARAQSLHLEQGYTGFFNRPQRLITLIICFAYPRCLEIVTWLFALLSNGAAVYRIVVYAAASRRE